MNTSGKIIQSTLGDKNEKKFLKLIIFLFHLFFNVGHSSHKK